MARLVLIVVSRGMRLGQRQSWELQPPLNSAVWVHSRIVQLSVSAHVNEIRNCGSSQRPLLAILHRCSCIPETSGPVHWEMCASTEALTMLRNFLANGSCPMHSYYSYKVILEISLVQRIDSKCPESNIVYTSNV
jgi:hypothetical protein